MKGYWEPHTSSVDFCELNYFHSSYFAEIHNVWSSLLITYMGLIGIIHGNPTRELPIFIMYLVLAVIGLGSACLHATLHWLPQSSDEIPMLWQCLSFLYMLWLHRYPSVDQTREFKVGISFISLALLQTILYYCFQQVYLVFLISMALYVITYIIWTHSAINSTQNLQQKAMRAKVFRWGFYCFVIFGFSIWIVDMSFCQQLTPIYSQLYGVTLHILWHIFAGLGAYFNATTMAMIHIQNKGKETSLKWVGGLPVCIILFKSDSKLK